MPNMKRLATIASIVLIFAIGSVANAATPVGLGTAGSFVVLAGAGITNTGPTTLNGDIGTYSTTTISGTASLTISGVNHAGDAVTQQAKTDLTTAYNNAAGQGPTLPIVADLAGQTLGPGVYNSATSIGLSGHLTLDGAGNPNAVFIFQAGSTLTTGSGSLVTMIGGAQSCNVFWQVGSSATLGTGSSFQGTILALTSITLTTGATIIGRALAQNGAVTMDTNTITRSTCAAPAPVPPTMPPFTVAPSATPTPAATATPSTPTATPSTPTTTPTAATATPAAVAQLPSTSTSGDLPLGAISVMLIAVGAALLLIRRQRTSTD